MPKQSKSLLIFKWIHCRRDRLPSPVFLGFPGGSAGKDSACNAGDLGLIPVLGRSPGEGKGYPLQYSGLENSIDYIVHGVTKSWTWLSDFHFQTQRENCESTTTPNPCCFFGLVSEYTVMCAYALDNRCIILHEAQRREHDVRRI